MSEASKQVPPVPDTIPMIKEDLGKQAPEKLISHQWSRWFLSVREKINILNEALVNFGIFGSGGTTGITVLGPGDTWVARTITGTAGRVTVANGSGVGGDPTINTIGNVRSITVTNLDIDVTDPENPAISFPPDILARVDVTPRWVPVPITAASPGTIGDVSMDTDYFYTCEAEDVWKRSARSTW